MKRLTLCIAFFAILLSAARAQVNPTLSVGLEALTMNKGTIDVKVLTEIIMDKQKELKEEALKRFLLSKFPETNYTSKFYLQNCLNILLNEKNPQVIEKQVLELTTNYALALGVAKVYEVALSKDSLTSLNNAYLQYRNHSPQYKNALIENYTNYKLTDRKLKSLTAALEIKKKAIDSQLRKINNQLPDTSNLKEYKNLRKLENERKELEKQISRIKLRHSAPVQKALVKTADTIPFGLLLDVVSSSLSEIESLKSKGFFKDAIDYRQDRFYQTLKSSSSHPDTVFLNALDRLHNKILKDISPYIDNYEIIKELFSAKLEKEASASIVGDLVDNYFANITVISGGIDDFVKRVTETITDSLSASEKLKRDAADLALAKQNTKVKGKNGASVANEKPGIATVKTPDASEKSIKDQLTARTTSLESLNKYKAGLNKYKTIVDVLKSTLETKEKALKSMAEMTAEYNELNADGRLSSKIGDIILTDTLSGLATSDTLKRLITLNQNFRKLVPDTADSLISNQNKLLAKQLLLLPANEQASLAHNISKSDQASSLIKLIIAKEDSIRTSMISDVSFIIKTGNFLSIYLNNMIDGFAGLQTYAIKDSLISELNKGSFEEYSELLSRAYLNLTLLAKQQNVALKDINYIDQELIPKLIKYGIIFNKEQGLQNRIREFRLLSQLLKIKAVLKVNKLSLYDPKLIKLFEFISNLDNLDHAETYQGMINIFRDVNSLVEDNLENGSFKNIYLVFSNAIKKYTLINSQEQYVQIEVVGFLNDLQQHYERNNTSRFGIYLTLGLNQSVFLAKPALPGADLPGAPVPSQYLGFASEKIGLKYRIASFNRVKDYENTIKGDVSLNKRQPFINQIYGIAYGSGLLYSIANTTTSDVKFDYPHIGIGLGTRFYNALDVNFFAGFPFVKDQTIFRNAFLGIGLDIPLGEYLEKLNSKK